MSPVLDVAVDRLVTTLAPLRGPRTDVGTALAPLPVRVAPIGNGTYQVLDGFKRLARWRCEGHTHVPVVVEGDAFSSVVGKAQLLEANTPKRTVSPMDEARVVHSLVTDDHLSPTQITKLLGRGRGWVDRRGRPRSARPGTWPSSTERSTWQWPGRISSGRCAWTAASSSPWPATAARTWSTARSRRRP